MFHDSPKLCKCGNLRRLSGRYCLDCHAAYMRTWRKTHPLTKSQVFKDTCRSYAGVYLRRGKIEKKGCQNCGDKDSQMHHEDYTKPLDVVWLCKEHHQGVHKGV